MRQRLVSGHRMNEDHTIFIQQAILSHQELRHRRRRNQQLAAVLGLLTAGFVFARRRHRFLYLLHVSKQLLIAVLLFEDGGDLPSPFLSMNAAKGTAWAEEGSRICS